VFTLDLSDAAADAGEASGSPRSNVVCHTPQPTPPFDDDDDEDDDRDRGSGGGNIDPDDDDGGSDEDEDDEDDTLWSAAGRHGSLRPLRR
jgi:hypothetical protein